MYIGRRCYQQGIKQGGVKQGLGVYVIKYYKFNQQAHCFQLVSSSLFIKNVMFQHLKGHYQGVETFIYDNISNR